MTYYTPSYKLCLRAILMPFLMHLSQELGVSGYPVHWLCLIRVWLPHSLPVVPIGLQQINLSE